MADQDANPTASSSVPRLLVVEDEADQRALVASLLHAEGYTTLEAACLAEASRMVAEHDFDIVLSDWQLPDGTGLDLLTALRADPAGRNAQVAFVMVTAYGTIARAVDAVRAGANDYLAKPFERQALILALERVQRAQALEDENRRLAAALDERNRLVDLVGSAPSMQRLYRRVEKLASTDATILLNGESGTGKELAARALHALSRRTDGPFVPVNCAAIPEGLIESEFFGVEKGAFTGADRARAGSFETASGGTLFLDEVGELPIAVQPKLLRALQEGRFSRVGSSHERQADARIIAATNRDLAAEVQRGTFREDLFYRLNVVPLVMPPLRARREDIPQLVEHFVQRAVRRHGLPAPLLPRRVLERLLDHPWPGNVRELGNAVERLVLLAEDGKASLDDLPASMRPDASAPSTFTLPPTGLSWDAHERDCLRQALDLAAGNRARAARLLDLPYKAFLYRLEKHQLAGS